MFIRKCLCVIKVSCAFKNKMMAQTTKNSKFQKHLKILIWYMFIRFTYFRSTYTYIFYKN